MSTYTSKIYIISLFLILVVLVLKPEVCLQGTTTGLLLWFNTVLPTLFPFFILTRLLLKLTACPKKLMKLYPVGIGLTAGYPTGAVTICELVKSNILTKKEGTLMLILANNASPGFLIGFTFTCSKTLKNPYLIWSCVILSSIITTLIAWLADNSHTDNKNTQSININHLQHTSQTFIRQSFVSYFEEAVMDSFKILLIIGGYIMFFSMASIVIMDIAGKNLAAVIFSSLLEISNGVFILSNENFCNIKLQNALISALCSFGGLSAYFQTVGIISSCKLSAIKYLLYKSFGSLISFILCYILLSIL